MQVLCIDVGGSFIKSAVIGPNADIKSMKRIPTPKDDMKTFLMAIECIYHEEKEINGISLSMPGIIDENTGFMFTGGSLRFIRDFDMPSVISRMCHGLPVCIVNDAKAGAAAELETGALNRVKNGVIVTIGTAWGGAVICNGKVLAGSHHFAGEFSFLAVKDSQNIYSSWGLRSGSSRLSTIYKENTNWELSPEEIFTHAEAGEKMAERAIQEYCAEIAPMLSNLQCVIDPEVIAIGGGISIQSLFIDTLQQAVTDFQQDNGFLQMGMPLSHIVACRYHDNTMGAYYLFMRHHFNRK